jgi:predicted small lipoprotein YifL
VKTTLIVAGALALTLSACGRMADLEAPPARETERAQRSGSGPAITEPATVNRPPSQQPIDGGPTDPFGSSPAGREPQ